MQNSILVGEALTRRLVVQNVLVGELKEPDPSWWDIELERARPSLELMARQIDDVMAQGLKPVSAITRCAVALATVPVVLRHRPDTVVVWLDAHADLNKPDTTTSGYLGGLALSGPLGWWESGLGAGLPTSQTVLVGVRDVDPAERPHIQAGRIAVVPVGDGLTDRLAEVVNARPVYFHLDCDVLEPGIVLTEYQVARGLTLQQLHDCAAVVADSEVVGVELGEFEGPAASDAEDLVEALAPLLA
jgi:arginase family enzyme